MPARISAWGVYDVFTVQGGEQISGRVSDTQWSLLCAEFGYADLLADSRWPATTTACARATG